MDWLATFVIPTGETPPPHSGVYANEWVVPLTIGARYFQRPDFWWLAKRLWAQHIVPSQKAVWMINEDFSSRALGGLPATPPTFVSRHLKPSGYAVMRTGWEPGDRYLVFQYGWGNTAHAYPGALSCGLMMNQEIIATNPGSPRSYRHPAYSYCYSTRAHNVVSLNNASYASPPAIAPGGKLLHLADLAGAWYVHALLEGYKKPKYEAVHERRMLVIKDGPVI